MTHAYKVIKSKAKRFAANVPLPSTESFRLNGTSSETFVTSKISAGLFVFLGTYHAAGVDLKKNLNAYLQDLEDSQVRNLQDIIDFNKKHAAEELPRRMPL